MGSTVADRRYKAPHWLDGHGLPLTRRFIGSTVIDRRYKHLIGSADADSDAGEEAGGVFRELEHAAAEA